MQASKRKKSRRSVAYFDSIAHRYHALYDESTPGGCSLILRRRRVLELFDRRGGNVLDVGCGPGVMVEALTDLECGFWGIDPSPRMIERANRAFGALSKVHFSVGSAEQLGFPDEFFDAVICMGVLERTGEDGTALREMVRVLKVGGTLIVTLPNRFSPNLLWRDYVFYPIVSLLRPFHRLLTGTVRRPINPRHRLYSERSFVRFAMRCGCEVTDIKYCVYNFCLHPLDSLLPGLCTSLLNNAEVLNRGRLRTLGGAFVVKARKAAR
ncbi:MAG: class I SAM-dependent methyltransferase [Thermoanaerobaculia bacterium]